MSTEEKANILLADDNEGKRLALAAVLESLGHNLVMARSGSEVLRLALQRDYAVVLLDVQMPEMDGFEIAKLIRDRKQSAHTPIIFITAYDRAEIDVLRGYALGAVDYIFAPVIPEILRAKVGVFVDLAVMRRKLELEVAERGRAALEIAALNASLNQRAAQLETTNRDLESFSYSVSHDLRAPLRAIRGYARMLEEEHAGGLDPEGRRLLEVILDGGERMEQLVEALLTFSRFNRAPTATVEIDMGGLAQAAFHELTVQLERVPELRLSALPRARGDPALIRQVWANLISNAIKYTGKRQRPAIEIDGHTERNGARLPGQGQRRRLRSAALPEALRDIPAPARSAAVSRHRRRTRDRGTRGDPARRPRLG
jgi:hypothetical protein